MENKLYDVTALGELLIDFTENGNSSQEILLLKQTRAALLQCTRHAEPPWQKNSIYRKSWKRYVRQTAESSC